MSDIKHCDEMCGLLKAHRNNLLKLREGTRNFNLLRKIDDALLEIDKAHLAIGRITGGKNGEKEIPNGEFEPLEKKWIDAVKQAQAVDEENARKRWHLGILWFCVFTFLFLVAVGLYIGLHWRYPSTDSDIFLWTGGALTYVEVAFWSFFGLLTWLLYSLQHWNRLGRDVRLWAQWYWSKLFAGVLIAVVIVVALKQVNFGPSITGSVIPVVVGFILGYYSDRARDYLDLIRDRLLPGTESPAVTIQPPELTSTSLVYIHGNVEGSPGTEGTLTVGKEPPVTMSIDDNGNFGVMVDVKDRPALIRVQAKSPAKKVGSATVSVDKPQGSQ